MQVIQTLSAIPTAIRGCVVAIGNFDGLHRGHQFLIDATTARARDLGEASCVLSFEPHPKHYFQPQLPPFRLTPLAQKTSLLRALGVDYFLCLDFNAAMAAVTADDFTQHILINQLGVSNVLVGQDFVFGHNRCGNLQTLRHYGQTHGFSVQPSDLLTDAEGMVISSSRIRDYLAMGDVANAANLLGRPFAIMGAVERGQQLATGLGFPTANVALGDYQHPAYGVYAVRVHTPQQRNLAGVANIGVRPTVGGADTARLEVHLFDWQGNLYDQTIEVELRHFLRPERKFNGLDELRAQIAVDVAEAKKFFSTF